MLLLPFQALRLLLGRPQLFFLSLFPGVFTIAGSTALAYEAWNHGIAGLGLFSVPAVILLFIFSWLILANIAMLPVEDLIINQVQLAVWQEVRLPSPQFRWQRLGWDLSYGVLIAAVGIIIFALSFVPVLDILDFVLAAWLMSYGFLSTLYSRQATNPSDRLKLFFQTPVRNFLLGALLNVLLFIPVLNVFLLGYAQVLASLFYFRQIKDELE